MANIYKASVTGLGNSSPTSQTYTMDEGFPTSFEEVTDDLGNIFIKIPTMYRKVDSVVDGQITAFTMSTSKEDDSYVPYSVFVKPNGEVMPYVLIGKYINSSTTSMVSIETTSAANINISNARTYAQALGDGYQQYDWQFQKLFQDLALLISQKVNFQDGSDVISSYLGLENFSRGLWIDGVAKDETTWCIAYDPTKYVDSATSSSDGYVAASYTAPTSAPGCISKLGYDENNPFFNYPDETVSNTSYNTYYCDKYFYSSGNRCVYSYVGYASAYAGLWHCRAYNSWGSISYARLCYRPLDETVQEAPTILIKNPLTIFTPATKVVGTDLVVNASEVEVVEDVQRGTFTFRGTYADDTSTGNAFFTIAFDIGSTWDDLINGKGNIEVTYESGSRFNSLVFSYGTNGSDVNIKYTTTSGTTYTDIVALASDNTIVIGSDLVIDEGVYTYFSSGGGGQ